MSDVKRFTGFIAIDGSTHTSEKLAVAHSREVKIKKALAEQFGGEKVVGDTGSEDLADYLFRNMPEITAAFNQEVLTRKKRTPKVKAPSINPESAAA